MGWVVMMMVRKIEIMTWEGKLEKDEGEGVGRSQILKGLPCQRVCRQYRSAEWSSA